MEVAQRQTVLLTDGKAGHENQSRAFARALGLEPVLVRVVYRSRFHKALSYLFSHLGVFTLSVLDEASQARCRDILVQRSFAVVIGTGSGTFYPVSVLARKLNIPCGVVLYPRGYRLRSFDCILAPIFDNPPKVSNVITIPANLVASDKAFYEAGEIAFRARFTPSGKPVVAVIVGGPNKCSTMSPEWMRKALEPIFEEKDVAFWVTTSRRTPRDVEAVVDSFPWDYKLIYSRDTFNPIPAFVKLVRTLWVTAESTGMLSEACTSGTAEVRVLDNLKPGPHKFRRFVENLKREGYVFGTRKVNLTDVIVRARALLHQ